jgi:hypothetical protein
MLEPNIADLITPEGFNRLFERHLTLFPDQPATRAYEATERTFSNNFGRNRYSSFDSFRNTRKKIVNR